MPCRDCWVMYMPCFGISAVSGASWWAMTGVVTLPGCLLRPIRALLNGWSFSMRRTRPYCSVRSAITRRKFRHRNTSAIITAAIAPYPSWYNYYRADPIKVPSSISDAAQTEMPDLAARFFADVAEPPATTSLRVDVPTLVLWGMQDPVGLPGQLDKPPRLCAECNRGSDRGCGSPARCSHIRRWSIVQSGTSCGVHLARLSDRPSTSAFGEASADMRGEGKRDGYYPLTIRRQCSHAARIKFSLASGVRNAECADSVTLSSFVSG